MTEIEGVIIQKYSRRQFLNIDKLKTLQVLEPKIWEPHDIVFLIPENRAFYLINFDIRKTSVMFVIL